MEFLKHILFLLFVLLGLFQTKLEAKSVGLENDIRDVFIELDFKETSAEKEWLGLLYLQEESTNQNQTPLLPFSSGSLSQSLTEKLCKKSTSKNLESSFQIGGKSTSHRENDGHEYTFFRGNSKLTKARGMSWMTWAVI